MDKNKKIIELKNISKSYDGVTVLDNIQLHIYDNEFLTLLGPSGCGKTTTLRMIGGFETPDTGDVLFLGERINDLPAHKRNVNTVFQRYALFPHLNVFDNVAFPLKEKKVPREEIEQKVTEMLQLVKLSGFEKRSVTNLSGGQQQRVAIARALVSRPQVLLLDEPLGALDLKLRKDRQQELKSIQKATGITFIFVTHDQEEALSMSDTIVVMSDGRIQQIGTPTDIYNEPKNAFVADFIGESNIVDGIMREDFKVTFSGHTFECVDKGFEKNEPVDVVVRPEDVDIVPLEKGMLQGLITSVTFMGVHYEIIVDINGFKWMIQTTDYAAEGEKVGIYIEPDAIHIMKKSEYSGMFGDYSSYSMEMDELSVVESEDEE
ncbi:MAG: ABC transporter ATP-binding protein [Oscillospiraceae bacterium]|nr:ABC transporter ATP-binding protein [Oscillospiraceae bacterium]